MSAEADISPIILDLAELWGSLLDLALASCRVEQMKTQDGRTHKVEPVFKDAVGRDVGVQKAEKGYRLVTDGAGLTPEQCKKQTESVQQVVQRYAYRKAVKELQAQGYSIAEESKQADGSIKLLVRKWSA